MKKFYKRWIIELAILCGLALIILLIGQIGLMVVGITVLVISGSIIFQIESILWDKYLEL